MLRAQGGLMILRYRYIAEYLYYETDLHGRPSLLIRSGSCDFFEGVNPRGGQSLEETDELAFERANRIADRYHRNNHKGYAILHQLYRDMPKNWMMLYDRGSGL